MPQACHRHQNPTRLISWEMADVVQALDSGNWLANQGRFSFCSRVKNAKQGLACQGTRIRDTRLQVNRRGRGVAMPLKCGVQEEFELSLPTLAERLEVK